MMEKASSPKRRSASAPLFSEAERLAFFSSERYGIYCLIWVIVRFAVGVCLLLCWNR